MSFAVIELQLLLEAFVAGPRGFSLLVEWVRVRRGVCSVSACGSNLCRSCEYIYGDCYA